MVRWRLEHLQVYKHIVKQMKETGEGNMQLVVWRVGERYRIGKKQKQREKRVKEVHLKSGTIFPFQTQQRNVTKI